MRILYLIGNGFDINLGMKTRYVDFCKYYQRIETDSEVLARLKKNISENITTWADLEKRLGEYFAEINSFEEFKEIYYDLVENLGNYLEDIEKQTDFSTANQDRLFTNLCFPEETLPLGDCSEIASYTSRWANTDWKIDIMTFNYTSTFEKLLRDDFEHIVIGSHHGKNMAIVIENIYHIHGLLDSGLILGVNDLSQLLNEKFHENKKITNAFIKSNYNRGKRTIVDKTCFSKIEAANLICIFGCSLGDTDNCWWERIGQRLLQPDCKLIIFTKGEEIKKRHSYNAIWIEEDIKDLFLSKTNLDDDDIKDIKDSIYVVADADIFSEILNKTEPDSLLITDIRNKV